MRQEIPEEPARRGSHISPEDWVTVDKIGRTAVLGPVKNGFYLARRAEA